MNWRNSGKRYGSVSIGLHWLMLFLIIAVYALMEFRGYFPKGSAERATMRTWHYMLGLSVLALVALRLILNLSSLSPGITPEPPPWQKWISKLVHFALYAFMIFMPVAGWLTVSAAGDPIPFFGLHLPALIGPNEALSESIEDLHKSGATVGYFLVGLHAAAALFHHYFLRDNTLRRMLPIRK
jgi:cytochrome b561